MKKVCKYFITTAIIVLTIVLLAQNTRAIEWDSGLEIEDHKRMIVFIDGFNDDNQKAGLSKELVRAKVELQLRKNEINSNPISNLEDGYLYINVNIVGSAYNVDVEFKRKVAYYSKGRTYNAIASVWETGGTGTYGQDSSIILKNLSNLLDMFINDYLKANQKLKQ